MNKILSLLLLTVYFSTSAFYQIQKGKFEISGTLSGFADSTSIFLDDVTTSSPIHIDSAIVINNKFHFIGAMKENVKHAILRTNNFSNYKFFVLFLGYALLYCIFIALASLSYFIMFWKVRLQFFLKILLEANFFLILNILGTIGRSRFISYSIFILCICDVCN